MSGAMRCFGAAPPNVYTRSRCSGVHRNVGASAGISSRSGAGRVTPAPVDPATAVALFVGDGPDEGASPSRALQAAATLATPREI